MESDTGHIRHCYLNHGISDEERTGGRTTFVVGVVMGLSQANFNYIIHCLVV